MKTSTHGNGNGLNDLYILPDDAAEARCIVRYLESIKRSFAWSYSDVEGSDWHGKAFFEIPFGESLEPGIREALTVKEYRAEFMGRSLGAIGAFYPIEAIAAGRNEEEARESLYNRFQDVHNLTLAVS